MARAEKSGEKNPGERDLLAVDVGNTTTRLGVFSGGELAGTWELTTPERLTVDEARLAVTKALPLMCDASPEDAVLACVVPSLADVWRRALTASCPGSGWAIGT